VVGDDVAGGVVGDGLEVPPGVGVADGPADDVRGELELPPTGAVTGAFGAVEGVGGRVEVVVDGEEPSRTAVPSGRTAKNRFPKPSPEVLMSVVSWREKYSGRP